MSSEYVTSSRASFHATVRSKRPFCTATLTICLHVSTYTLRSGLNRLLTAPHSSRLTEVLFCVRICTAVQEKLHRFGWFEMWLGLLMALMLVGALCYVGWAWNERKRKRDEFRTAHNLEHNIEPRFLARLLGEVRFTFLLQCKYHMQVFWSFSRHFSM